MIGRKLEKKVYNRTRKIFKEVADVKECSEIRGWLK